MPMDYVWHPWGSLHGAAQLVMGSRYKGVEIHAQCPWSCGQLPIPVRSRFHGDAPCAGKWSSALLWVGVVVSPLPARSGTRGYLAAERVQEIKHPFRLTDANCSSVTSETSDILKETICLKISCLSTAPREFVCVCQLFGEPVR